MRAETERRALQAAILLGGLVPVGGGLLGIVAGPAAFDAAGAGRALESHFAYLSGLLLAIGLGFWSCVPAIEARAARFRGLALIVAAGGFARLASLALSGAPPAPYFAALGMELGVTPALALWRERVARRLALVRGPSSGGVVNLRLSPKSWMKLII